MKKNIKIIIGLALGSLIGFGYYYFIGCRSGSCPLTGNPYISTLYGAVLGLLISSGSSKTSPKSD